MPLRWRRVVARARRQISSDCAATAAATPRSQNRSDGLELAVERRISGELQFENVRVRLEGAAATVTRPSASDLCWRVSHSHCLPIEQSNDSTIVLHPVRREVRNAHEQGGRGVQEVAHLRGEDGLECAYLHVMGRDA